jgi:protein gp37
VEKVGKTKIEWTEYSWNPVTGCTPASEGCQNCYAKRMANRLAGRCGYPADDPFRVTLHPEKLEEPLKWKKPRRVFVCSMGDLFHEQVPDEYIAKVWEIMNNASHHTFLILTKRPQRMKDFLARLGWYIHDRDGYPMEAVLDEGGKYTLKNVWLGVTAENQQRADERIPILLQIPAAVRFVSIEPMLGPVDLSLSDGVDLSMSVGTGLKPGKSYLINSLDWVICGGESGSGARPMHPDWVRSLRDRCQAAGTPFFFKSWGEWAEHKERYGGGLFIKLDGSLGCQGDYWEDNAVAVRKVGKKKAGRLLDGRTWDEIP